MIDRERRRLRRAFGMALLAGAVPAALYACSDETTLTPVDGGLEAQSDSAAQSALDAPTDVLMDVGADAVTPTGDAACAARLTFVDGGVGDAADDADASSMDAEANELCHVLMPCGLPSNLGAVGCEIVSLAPNGNASLDAAIGCQAIEDAGCSAGVFQPAGPLTLKCDCEIFVGGGRRPARLRRVARVRATDALGDYLARMAHEEAASVRAFETLGVELAGLGGPAELVRGATRAAKDEVRHARVLGGAARARGAEPPKPRCRRSTRRRDLETVARENAVEGCVHETYGALLAHWQARHAEDPELRRAFERVAVDETRHAALAWAIARWADTRLDDAARRRVLRAQRRAIRELARRLERAPSPAVIATAGVPDRAQAGALFGEMVRGLFG
jgi:hypothetical protein